jgi:hypothetical protein
MKTHLHRLGIIYTVYGWLGVLLTIPCVFLTVRDIQRLENGMNITEWQPISFLFIAIPLLIFLFSLFYLAFGNALINERAWATRVVGFIIGILLLFQFPIGTIVGGYTLWVLSKLDQSTLKQT